MPENRSRFVLLCQQSLAFAVVAAIAAPAANMVTLDIVSPARPHAAGVSAPAPAGTRGSTVTDTASGGVGTPSLVPSGPVKPRVTAVRLGGVNRRGLDALRSGTPAARASAGDATLAAAEGTPGTDLAVLSAPQPVDSLATVGVTWADGQHVSEQALTVSVRTETDGTWSGWETMPYHDEHGPDAGSSEAGRTRPGTDPVYVGHVDDVQVKAVTDTGLAPADMQLALVDPGAQKAAAVERPAIDTGTLDLSSADTTGGAALASGAVTAKPMIYSRAQWGADERMRDPSSLHYGEVHAAFVHHTVNANDYTAAQVPAIIRGIYAYHTQSRGWSDVGYNFLVDRFGRIWEGRYGGVDRPVVGAHTLGYNDDAFAMSAIGNFETARPSAAVLDAYGRLFAWKLSLHGVSAGSTRQWVTKRYLPAINGHRDVDQTACPGKYLYAQIPRIRQLAVAYQKSFASRNRAANLTGTAAPDVVLRDKATQQGYVLRSGGQSGFTAGSVARTGVSGADLLTSVGDATGDGRADLLVRTRSGSTVVLAGDGAGHFAGGTRPSPRFAGADLLTGVGDWNGDGHNDVVTRNATTERLFVQYGDGSGGFGATRRTLSPDWSGYSMTTGAGDFDQDGHPDLIARSTDGRLWLVRGTGSALGARTLLSGGWSGFDLTAGAGDLTRDGVPDVVARNRVTRQTWVYPGNGRGGFAARRGPFTMPAGLDRLLSPGQVRGSSAGDLVGRDSTGRILVFTGSGAASGKSLVPMGRALPQANLLLNVGDWDGDGKGDVMTRSAAGVMYLLRGQGTGSFAAPVSAGTGFGAVRLLAAVGDLTGDGYPDLMGQPAGGAMRIYPGDGTTGFRPSFVAYPAVTGSQQVGMGLWNSDGSPDTLVRRSDGSLVVYAGNGPGGLTGATNVGSLSSGYDWLLAVGDLNGDRRPDLLARTVSTGELWLLPGTSTGFGSRTLFMSGMARFDLAG